MNRETKAYFNRHYLSLFFQAILMTPAVILLSPLWVYLVLKSGLVSTFPAIIKVKKTNGTSKPIYAYRFHPELASRSKIVQISNKLLEKYSIFFAISHI